MKIFLSIPMNGKTKEEILKRIEHAKHLCLLEHKDAEFVDGYTEDLVPENIKKDRVWYLGKSFQKIAECDAVYFTKDWWLYNGCTLERKLCNEYDIPFLDEYILSKIYQN